jgi:hypothetical protein
LVFLQWQWQCSCKQTGVDNNYYKRHVWHGSAASGVITFAAIPPLKTEERCKFFKDRGNNSTS